MHKAIIYQILPRLWNSGESRKGEPVSGKFSDIDASVLSYIKGLGASYVWYTGVIRHASTYSCKGCPASHPDIVKGLAGSPYAIVDYYDVNPYLADSVEERMDEFESLLKRSHDAGLKVAIDFVPNHVSRDCGKAGNACQYVLPLGAGDDSSVHWAPSNDFYYYPGEALKLPDSNGYEENPAKASGNCFSSSPDRNDWYETIRLNYCDFHTATWDKMYEIVRFWCKKGVDAFRCDMVEMVPWQFFKWMIEKIKQEFPDVAFIAEVYSLDKYQLYADIAGFDLLYDKSGLYDKLRAVVEGRGSARSLTLNWQELGGRQPGMLNFLENHDEQRFASDFFGGDARRSFAALGVSLLFSTSSFMLYFGEEIGERGMDEEGFSGLDGRTSIFDWCSPHCSKALIEYIHTGKGLTDAESSLLERWTGMLRTAVEEASFRDGEVYDLCFCNDGNLDLDKHFAFLRGHAGKAFLVVCNFSNKDAVLDVSIPADAFAHVGKPSPARTVSGLKVAHDDCQIIGLQ